MVMVPIAEYNKNYHIKTIHAWITVLIVLYPKEKKKKTFYQKAKFTFYVIMPSRLIPEKTQVVKVIYNDQGHEYPSCYTTNNPLQIKYNS